MVTASSRTERCHGPGPSSHEKLPAATRPAPDWSSAPHSLTRLTGPAEDEQSEAMLSREELDELMTLSDVPAWLTQMGATER